MIHIVERFGLISKLKLFFELWITENSRNLEEDGYINKIAKRTEGISNKHRAGHPSLLIIAYEQSVIV